MVCFISFLNWKITAVQYCVGFCRTTVWIECHVFQIQHCFKDLEVESSPLPDETRIALHLLSDGYLIYILNQYFINMLWVWLALPSELLPHDLVTGGIPHAGSRQIFLPAILIPASSPAFLMMYSAYKLNKQGDNIQPWCTPFRIGTSLWFHVQF